MSYQDIARAVIQGETEGFAKIIAERSSGQILGAAIVGAQACELISEIAVAMAGRGSAWLVGDTQHPYPTLSELVRWTADQVGKASRSAAEQAPGVPVAVPAMLRALTIAGPYIGHARALRSGETAASVAHGIMERKDV